MDSQNVSVTRTTLVPCLEENNRRGRYAPRGDVVSLIASVCNLLVTETDVQIVLEASLAVNRFKNGHPWLVKGFNMELLPEAFEGWLLHFAVLLELYSARLGSLASSPPTRVV